MNPEPKKKVFELPTVSIADFAELNSAEVKSRALPIEAGWKVEDLEVALSG